jgi:putative ABC transport system permease protein
VSFQRMRSFFRNLFRKQKVDAQLDQEVSSYLHMLIEEKMASGMTREQATRAAKIELGGSDQVKEHVRDVRAGAWLETLIQDVRFGFRMIGRNPGFSSLVVLALALGIGANTAIFSVVYGVLLRPLPYPRGGDLVVLHQYAKKLNLPDVPFSVKELEDYRQNHTLSGVVEYHSMAFLLLGNDSAERVQTGVVSHNFFDVLGVKPLLGRSFLDTDESPKADAVLMLSYDYWQHHQGGDPNIVGKVFQMNNRPHTVIGVLPPIPQYPAENDVYMPTSACPTRSSKAFRENRESRMMVAFGRVKPGTPLQTAQADLSTIARRLEAAYPQNYKPEYGYGLLAAPLQTELTQKARITLLILLGASGFVLLIACANVANLMLARILKRERELAVRSALGASKLRLIRQLLTETVLLAVGGGALGLAIAPPVLQLLVKFAARFTTRAAEVKLDWHVLVFTFVVSIAAGLLFGMAPAFSSTRQLNDALKQAGNQSSASQGGQRLRAGLVVAQVTVSFVLLIGAGLMMRSILALEHVDPGFRPDRLLTLRMSANFTKYDNNVKFTALMKEVLARINSVSGVESAAIASNFPFNPGGIASGPGKTLFQIQGRPAQKEDAATVDTTTVGTGYFEAVRQPLISGRTFTDHDDDKAPALAVINQTMAHHRWPNEDPIGQHISFDNGQHWTQIVGVVGDVREYGFNKAPEDEVYMPALQRGFGSRLVVRTMADPLSFAPVLRSAIHSVDSQIAIDQVNSIERLQEESVASPRITTMLLGIFAGLALVISATGIAGVMALSVSQRAHELGIRMALGQSRTSIIQMLLREGFALAGGGTMLGIAGALVLGRLLASLLYNTSTRDVITFGAVSGIFLVVASVACMLPARRVTLIDPSIALRQE